MKRRPDEPPVNELDSLPDDMLIPLRGGETMAAKDLKTRVSVVEPGIILMHDVPAGSVRSIELFIDKMLVLGKDHDPHVYVIDISDARGKPPAGFRETITESIQHAECVQNLYVLPRNPVSRVVLRFILARVKEIETSFHKTRAEAIDEARLVLARLRASA